MCHVALNDWISHVSMNAGQPNDNGFPVSKLLSAVLTKQISLSVHDRKYHLIEPECPKHVK